MSAAGRSSTSTTYLPQPLQIPFSPGTMQGRRGAEASHHGAPDAPDPAICHREKPFAAMPLPSLHRAMQQVNSGCFFEILVRPWVGSCCSKSGLFLALSDLRMWTQRMLLF